VARYSPQENIVGETAYDYEALGRNCEEQVSFLVDLNRRF